MANANTGFVGCLILEQYYLDTLLPTGVVAPNDPSHPAYIPPTFNPNLCPVGSPLPTPTPTPTPIP